MTVPTSLSNTLTLRLRRLASGSQSAGDNSASVFRVGSKGRSIWLTGEHYERERPLSYHAGHLPRDVLWYADPSGAGEINELQAAGFRVNAGNNERRTGIMAVRSRLENGTLKVLPGHCPNLLAEAELYRYADDPEGRRSEAPQDDHNHALDALRYLVSKIDWGKMARGRVARASASGEGGDHRKKPDWWLRLENPEIWRRVW